MKRARYVEGKQKGCEKREEAGNRQNGRSEKAGGGLLGETRPRKLPGCENNACTPMRSPP